jgi:uncharacterized membrane protein
VEAASTSAYEAPGAAAAAPPPSAAAAPIANDNVLGALAYVTVIPAIIFLLLEPYNRNRFVRFHALQCLMLAATWFVFWMANLLLAIPLTFLSFVGTFIQMALGFVIVLAMVIAWIMAVVKAYSGEEYRLPVIGDYAAKYV